MKYIHIVLLLVLPKIGLSQAYFQLKGNLKNFSDNSIHMTVYRNWVENPEELELKLDKKKNFYVSIPLNEIAYCDINMGDYGLIQWKIEPNDILELSADYAQFDSTLEVSGYGSGKWKYQMEQIKKFEKEKDWDYELETLRNVSRKGFFDLTNYLYNEQNTLLSHWKDSLSEAFYSLQRADIYGKYRSAELGYLVNNKIFDDQAFSSFQLRVFNSKTQVKSYEFGRFIENLLDNHNKIKQQYPESSLLEYEGIKAYGEEKDLIDKNLIERILALKTIAFIEKDPHSEELKFMIGGMKENFVNRQFVNAVLQKFSSYRSTLQGKEMKAITLPDFKGDMVSTRDFKGKYLMVSFFTTWCEPCMKDIESIQIASSYLKNRNINFVFISLDSKEDFDSYMKSKQPVGIYLHGYDNEVINNVLHMDNVPNYLILDKNGVIIKNDFKDPSEDEGRMLIRELETLMQKP
ncbi:MAG: TlpA family protein disulfide reductase [Leadbetterella sp.]